jgi:hypothetical protein
MKRVLVERYGGPEVLKVVVEEEEEEEEAIRHG